MDGVLERCALDALAIGIIVTDRDAAVAFTNSAAEALLDSATALARRGGRLYATETTIRADLRAAIVDACEEDDAGFGRYILMRGRRDGERDVVICVLPLGQKTLSSPQLAMVIVRPIEREDNLEIEGRRLFGLTRSEARIASAIASGLSLQEAAAKHNVTLATVRSHMKRVYSKMGVSRQSQVAALLHGAHIPVHAMSMTSARLSGSRPGLASQIHRPD